jgi:hypothetical protein
MPRIDVSLDPERQPWDDDRSSPSTPTTVFAVVLILVAVGLGVYAWRSGTLGSNASGTPEVSEQQAESVAQDSATTLDNALSSGALDPLPRPTVTPQPGRLAVIDGYTVQLFHCESTWAVYVPQPEAEVEGSVRMFDEGECPGVVDVTDVEGWEVDSE